jgi:hypothetical protein
LDLVRETGKSGMNSSNTNADRTGRNNFIKSATFDMGKDRLLFINYDVTQNRIQYYIRNGPGFSSNDASVSTGLRQDAVVTYQKNDNSAKKLEFKFNYNNNTNDFELAPVSNSASTFG